MSTAISLAVPDNDLARIESIATECALSGADGSHMIHAFRMAAGIRALRAAITKKIMDEIMALQGTSLGFRTDKDPQGYDEETVKECVIEHLLRGGHVVGNEMNIIAKRPYQTKEFFTRKLRQFPGFSDLRLSPGVPVMSNGGALVPYVATWKLNGVPDSISRNVTKLADGTQLDERICVRVNAQMGADAILGKAERKIKAAIYARLTGSDLTDGEADDAVATSKPIRKLDDLTHRLEGKVDKPSEPVDETTQETEPLDLDAPFANCEGIRDVDDVLGKLQSDPGVTDIAFEQLQAAADRRKAAIRAGRGK